MQGTRNPSKSFRGKLSDESRCQSGAAASIVCRVRKLSLKSIASARVRGGELVEPNFYKSEKLVMAKKVSINRNA
jgi:hypothetical protein